MYVFKYVVHQMANFDIWNVNFEIFWSQSSLLSRWAGSENQNIPFFEMHKLFTEPD